MSHDKLDISLAQLKSFNDQALALYYSVSYVLGVTKGKFILTIIDKQDALNAVQEMQQVGKHFIPVFLGMLYLNLYTSKYGILHTEAI